MTANGPAARLVVRPWILAGSALVVWVLFGFLTGLGLAAMLAGVAGAFVGVLAGAGLGATGPRRTTPAARPDAAAPGSSPAQSARDPVHDALSALQALLGARRLILWTSTAQDGGTGSVLPRYSTGYLPMAQSAAGSPLAWCARQDQPLRLDPRPPWADADVIAVPVTSARERTVLTVERDPADSPVSVSDGAGDNTGQRAAAGAAAILTTILDLEQGRQQGGSDIGRNERLLDFLRALPHESDPGAFPDALARAAASIANGDGALVASWDPDAAERQGVGGHGSGVVLARCGQAGGPAPGAALGGHEGDPGDLVLAALATTSLARDGRTTTTRPLAGPSERWTARPRCTTVVPLLDPAGRCGGLVAVWGDDHPDPAVVAFLEALGPLLAVQLRYSLDLARFRDRADRDSLTRLPNRAALDERLRLEIRRFHRYRRPLALLILDLDHFKRVNDTYGHPAGDAVLQRVADILRANTRDPDFPARYGGEEMVVVLPETMLLQARDVAERIRGAIDAAGFEHDGRAMNLTVSIGVSACPECVDEPGQLLATADAALYRAKRGGRNRVSWPAIEGAELDHGGER